jgi:hypothetical protein
MLAGELEVDLVPQGTLIERSAPAGFGLGGVLTPTGVGTVVEKGKQRIELAGKPYLLETALRADFALVQAFLADYIGNLYYALTARNFNPVIAMAADTVIVEADNIVARRRDRPRPRRDARAGRRLHRSRTPDHGRPDHHRQAHRAGAARRHAGQPRHRHSRRWSRSSCRPACTCTSSRRTA